MAVKDFSSDMQDGEFIILVGFSGCEKTTNLRSITGLEELTYGKIHIGDRLVNDVSPLSTETHSVSKLCPLSSHGCVRNVFFGLKLRKTPKQKIDEPLSNLDAKLRIAMWAELLDLHQRLKITTIYVIHPQSYNKFHRKD